MREVSKFSLFPREFRSGLGVSMRVHSSMVVIILQKKVLGTYI